MFSRNKERLMDLQMRDFPHLLCLQLCRYLTGCNGELFHQRRSLQDLHQLHHFPCLHKNDNK
jgi:hypothetical protein